MYSLLGPVLNLYTGNNRVPVTRTMVDGSTRTVYAPSGFYADYIRSLDDTAYESIFGSRAQIASPI